MALRIKSGDLEDSCSCLSSDSDLNCMCDNLPVHAFYLHHHPHHSALNFSPYFWNLSCSANFPFFNCPFTRFINVTDFAKWGFAGRYSCYYKTNYWSITWCLLPISPTWVFTGFIRKNWHLRKCYMGGVDGSSYIVGGQNYSLSINIV